MGAVERTNLGTVLPSNQEEALPLASPQQSSGCSGEGGTPLRLEGFVPQLLSRAKYPQQLIAFQNVRLPLWLNDGSIRALEKQDDRDVVVRVLQFLWNEGVIPDDSPLTPEGILNAFRRFHKQKPTHPLANGLQKYLTARSNELLDQASILGIFEGWQRACLEDERCYDLVKHRYRTSLIFDEGNPAAIFQWGVFLAAADKPQEAWIVFRESAAIKPGLDPRLSKFISRYLEIFAIGEWLAITRSPFKDFDLIKLQEDAINQEILKNPEDADLHFKKGFLLLSSGKNSEATAAFSRSIQLFEDHPEKKSYLYGAANLFLAQQLIDHGSTDDVPRHLEKAKQSFNKYLAPAAQPETFQALAAEYLTDYLLDCVDSLRAYR